MKANEDNPIVAYQRPKCSPGSPRKCRLPQPFAAAAVAVKASNRNKPLS